MATIRATAKLTSFNVNGLNKSLQPATLNTQYVLNAGELVGNTVTYIFKIDGLLGQTIESITVTSLLLNSDATYCSRRPITISLIKDGGIVGEYTGMFDSSDSSKVPIKFGTQVQEETSSSFELKIKVSTTSTDSVYYGLTQILLSLSNSDQDVQIFFSGPLTNRTVSNISTATLSVIKGAKNVSFSKDPSTPFNSETDNVNGRVYFKQDGIYVDQYQYGIVAPATELKKGVVSIKSSFETDAEGNIIAPTNSGVAATPQMVYNAIASVKQYTDELVGGIVAPDIFIEEEETQKQLKDTIIFSDDFEATEENKLYLKWLEIV